MRVSRSEAKITQSFPGNHHQYLVHAGVGEEQGGVIQWDGGGRVDVLVLMLPEEVDELLADLSGSQ